MARQERSSLNGSAFGLGYEMGAFSRNFADGHERNSVVCVSGRVPQSLFLVESRSGGSHGLPRISE